MALPKSLRTIERMMKPGWSFAPDHGGHHYVVGPDGYNLRMDNGAFFTLSNDLIESSPLWFEGVAFLRKHGAIPPAPRRRRRAKEQHEPRKIKTATNPIILSRAILADGQSTARERKIAAEYLKLLANHEEVMLWAKKIGQRLQEYQRD